MLKIDPDLHIASGYFRDCYMHPDSEGLCIKVQRAGRPVQPHLDEIEFLERVGRYRNLSSSPVIAGYHGTVDTDRGPGVISELVRDIPSGNISTPLAAILADPQATISDRRLDRALDVFRKGLLASGIICKDLNPRNICVQRIDDEIVFRLIDGYGNPKASPLIDRIKILARRQTRGFLRRERMTSMAAIRVKEAELATPSELERRR